MTRPVRDAPLHTLAGRTRLPARSQPYWRSIHAGLSVGWERTRRAPSGKWLARLQLPGNDIRKRVLGIADVSLIKPDGVSVLSYPQAVDAAQRWAAAEKAGRAARLSTIAGNTDPGTPHLGRCAE